MSLRGLRAVGAALLLAAMFAALPATAMAVAGWDVRLLDSVTGSAGYGPPTISGDRVVWYGSADSTNVVWTYKVGLDTTRVALTDGSIDSVEPVVSGDRVAWLCEVAGEHRVFTRLVGEAAVQVSENGQDCHNLGISVNRLVWQQGTQIRTIVAGTETTTTRVDASDTPKLSPAVSGGRIVWLEGDRHVADLWTWKASDVEPARVATGVAGGAPPAVSGDRIAWAKALTPGGNYFAFTQLWDSPGGPVQVSDDLRTCDLVDVSGSRVAWTEYGSTYRICTRVMDSPTGSMVISPELDDFHDIRVSGDLVAWTDVSDTSGGTRLLAVKVGADSTPTVVASGTRIEFAASDDRIAWLDRGGAYSIFYAERVPDAANTYSLTYDASVGGSVSGISPQTVDQGSNGTTVTAVPDIGYRFASWSDGVLTPARRDMSVGATITVTANFAALPKTKRVSSPIGRSTMYRGHRATFYGYVWPRHSSGTYLVTLRFYLKSKNGTYVYHHSVSARRYYYSSSKTKYRATFSLPHKGKWRVRAVHVCAIHGPSYSGYDYITVK
jgi:hypothetical protein